MKDGDTRLLKFMQETAALYRESTEANRQVDYQSYLDYDQWNRWGNAAIRAGLVQQGELKGEIDYSREVNRYLGEPGLAPRLFRVAILRTWSRVMESLSMGLTAEQHFKNQLLAENREKLQRGLDEESRIRELQARARGSSQPHKHSKEL